MQIVKSFIDEIFLYIAGYRCQIKSQFMLPTSKSNYFIKLMFLTSYQISFIIHFKVYIHNLIILASPPLKLHCISH